MSCSVAITVAMPAVKPVVTGWGMNSMSRPSRASPITIRMTPPSIPASSSPASPNCVKMGARMTMNAAVGPVTCSARAAERRDDAARDDRRVEAVLRRDPDRDRQRHRERQRDDADDDAGEDIGAKVGPPVAFA